MAPRRGKRIAAAAAAAAIEIESQAAQATVNSDDNDLAPTKVKTTKKGAAKSNAKVENGVVAVEKTSPKQTKKPVARGRSKQEKVDVEEVEPAIEEPIANNVEKKPRGIKGAKAKGTNENSENDKRAANNMPDDVVAKKQNKRQAKEDKTPSVEEKPIDVKPKKATKQKSSKNNTAEKPEAKPKASEKRTKSKAKVQETPEEQSEESDSVEPRKKSKAQTAQIESNDADAAPKKRSKGKADQAKQSEPETNEVVPVKGRKRASDKAKETVTSPKKSKQAEKKIEKASPAKATVTSRKRKVAEEQPPQPVEKKDELVTKRKKAAEKPKVEKEQPKTKEETDLTKTDFNIDKDFNVKICSWNVAGLRAMVGKNGFDYFEYEKPDIICLQEIKCLEDQVPDGAKLLGYHPYWCSTPGGRGGVAILSKQMPYSVENNIGDAEMDEEGRIMTAEYSKFYLINVYVPNAGSKLKNLDRRLRWNKIFEEHVNKLKAKKPVVIVGDMNVAHTEIDLANPKTNTKNAGFTKEERDGMTDLLSHGFVDTFRHFYPNREQAYTFWTYMRDSRANNVGWRLDYGIVSESLLPKVVDNIIRHEVRGSDHLSNHFAIEFVNHNF